MSPDGALLEAREINCWRGEFLKITGPNGVGKTTLLRVVCGLLPAESGTVHWRGQVVRSSNDQYHVEMAYLGHLNSLKADLTARENLRFLAGLREALTPADIDGALDRVGILSRGDLPARSLSAGQKRRLALARLLLAGASLWVLDEPVTNLDTAGFQLVEQLIREHVEGGGMALAAAHQRLLDDAPFLRRLELR